jgi:hypothetical protein
MVAINFTVFQDKILTGAKRQTIRQTARCRPGDTLHLYTGLRTKQCRLLGTAICTRVEPVQITETPVRAIILNNRRTLRGAAANGFAAADGFDSLDDLLGFFRDKYRLPFSGMVISWSQFTPVPPAEVLKAAMDRKAAA